MTNGDFGADLENTRQNFFEFGIHRVKVKNGTLLNRLVTKADCSTAAVASNTDPLISILNMSPSTTVMCK